MKHLSRVLKTLSALFPLLGFGVALCSCDNVSCPLNNTVECVYGFYASARTSDGVFEAGSAVSVGDTITITALGPDTILANKLINQSGVSLPASYYGQVDILQFSFADANGAVGYDTIWVAKDNLHHWDDPSCAVHIWHTITSVRSTTNLIDTVLVSEPEINYDGLENIQIYFRTSSSDEETDEEADEESSDEESDSSDTSDSSDSSDEDSDSSDTSNDSNDEA